MRRLEQVLALLGIIAIGLGAWQYVSAKEARQKIAPITAERDSLISVAKELHASIVTAESVLVIADSVAAEELRRVHAETDSAQARARRAETDLRTYLVERGDTTAVARLEVLLVEHAQVVESLTTETGILRLQLTERNQLLDRYREENATLWGALDRANEVAAYWEREANPSIGVRLWEGIPGLAITGVGGYAGSLAGDEVGALIGAAGGYLLTELLDL